MLRFAYRNDSRANDVSKNGRYPGVITFVGEHKIMPGKYFLENKKIGDEIKAFPFTWSERAILRGGEDVIEPFRMNHIE